MHLKRRMKMKLSEAMMLGDSLRVRNGEYFIGEKDGVCVGCAIGGAILAVGHRDSWDRFELWPWLQSQCPSRLHLHSGSWTWQDRIGCEAPNEEFPGGFTSVCRGESTFEKLVDYVRSIEPDCGECNQFECTCQKEAPILSPLCEGLGANLGCTMSARCCEQLE